MARFSACKRAFGYQELMDEKDGESSEKGEKGFQEKRKVLNTEGESSCKGGKSSKRVRTISALGNRSSTINDVFFVN